jgi:predicted dehydrogenase
VSTCLRIAVIGAGAFGRNHLRVLHDLAHVTSTASETEQKVTSQNNIGLETPQPALRSTANDNSPGSSPLPNITVELAAVVDRDPQARTELGTRYNIPAFAGIDELLAARLDLQAATVAVPTIHHASVATQLLEANLDVLVEKPLTATLQEADALIALATRRERILAAGHLERFNPAVGAALSRLTRPMFFEAHRLSVFTPRSLDVDVVLDLMIHDLDILLTMANAAVAEVRAVGLPVLSRKVDIANVRLEFASGAIANLTASRISTEQVRKLRLFQPAQYLSLDYARQELLTINVDPSQAAALGSGLAMGNPVQSVSGPQPHPSAGLSFDKLAPPRAEPLRLELQDFLHAVATRTPPRVTAHAARNALALALDINAAIAAHAQITGLGS